MPGCGWELDMKKNLRILSFLMIAVMLLGTMVSLTGCGQKEEDENTFVVGFDAEFPPYGYKDESGEYVGFDLDLAQEVCDRKGWTLKKQPIDWDSKDNELSSGQIDCIWNGFTINGREDKYTWSEAYVDNSQVVVVMADSGITSLSDLKGKTVIVQTDSSALAAFTGEDATEENLALAESFKDLQQVADYNSAFLNLESGAADAVCLDYGVANYEVSSRGNEFVMLEENVSTEQYGIGFKLGNTELRDEVQEVLDEMYEDGTFMGIATKWGLQDSVCLGEAAVVASDSDAEETVSNTGAESKTEKLNVAEVAKQLVEGMLASLAIFFLTLLFSLPLGLFIMAVRKSKLFILRWIAKIYISIMRGTPLMLQLLVVFFGPYYVFGISTSSEFRFYAVIIGFSLNYAAYFAEIFRSGVESIPKGQNEAAAILGYNRVQTFWKITFPQMVKRVLPPTTNEIITLVKDTSLAFALAYTEMFTLAKQISAAQASIVPLFVAGLFYYIFNLVVAVVMERIEKSIKFQII